MADVFGTAGGDQDVSKVVYEWLDMMMAYWFVQEKGDGV